MVTWKLINFKIGLSAMADDDSSVRVAVRLVNTNHLPFWEQKKSTLYWSTYKSP